RRRRATPIFPGCKSPSDPSDAARLSWHSACSTRRAMHKLLLLAILLGWTASASAKTGDERPNLFQFARKNGLRLVVRNYPFSTQTAAKKYPRYVVALIAKKYQDVAVIPSGETFLVAGQGRGNGL